LVTRQERNITPQTISLKINFIQIILL